MSGPEFAADLRDWTPPHGIERPTLPGVGAWVRVAFRPDPASSDPLRRGRPYVGEGEVTDHLDDGSGFVVHTGDQVLADDPDVLSWEVVG